MADDLTVTFAGIAQFEGRLQELSGEMQALSAKMGVQAADAAKNYADPITPYLTGYLLSRNIVTVNSDDTATFSNDTPYGGYVNFGTRFMSAQPFFSQAVDYAKGVYPDIAVKGAKQMFNF